MNNHSVQFSSVQFSHSWIQTPWIAACQASLSITNSRSSLRFTSIESVMPSSHLILCRPLLLPVPEVKWSEVKSLSRVRLFATPCTVARQAPLSMGFSRQEYWSGLPFPPPGDRPYPGLVGALNETGLQGQMYSKYSVSFVLLFGVILNQRQV